MCLHCCVPVAQRCREQRSAGLSAVLYSTQLGVALQRTAISNVLYSAEFGSA